MSIWLTAAFVVATGQITAWKDGDHVKLDEIWGEQTGIEAMWSIATFWRGYFYDDALDRKNELALVTGAADVAAIGDAEALVYTDYFVQKVREGQFVVYRNARTGRVAALRLDRVFPSETGGLQPDGYFADVTWYLLPAGETDFGRAEHRFGAGVL